MICFVVPYFSVSLDVADANGRVDVVEVTTEVFEKLEAFRNTGAIKEMIESPLNVSFITALTLNEVVNDRRVGCDRLLLEDSHRSYQLYDALEVGIRFWFAQAWCWEVSGHAKRLFNPNCQIVAERRPLGG